MATPDWPLFGAAVAVLTLALLALSHRSAGLLATEADRGTSGEPADDPPAEAVPAADPTPPLPDGAMLAANVALTHGLVVVVLGGLLWYAAVPLPAVGFARPTGTSLLVGVALGVGLYLASEAATALGTRLGVEYDEGLRALLAPSGRAEWALLLGVSLPLIAVAEELLFRGVLVGAAVAGLGLPPWAAVVGAAVLFGLGHGAQGRVGMVVTAALGLVLGAAFVLTGSLVVVIVAHYVIDALEFGVREGLLEAG